MTGSEARYYRRKEKWDRYKFPWWHHHFWWLVHNLICHPILGIYYGAPAILFHDWSSKVLNFRTEIQHSTAPIIPRYWDWLWHNVVGHLAIGLFPCTATFQFHDRTAENMNVENWL